MRYLASVFAHYVAAISSALAATPVPEPETFALFAIGAVGLAIASSRKKK